jgi:glycerol-3-phosphate cytidylyltransferase
MFQPPPVNSLLDRESVRHYDRGRFQLFEDVNLQIPGLDGLLPGVSLARISALLEGAGKSHAPLWWIGVGTALGFAREKDFVPGDTDIDVRIGLDYAGNKVASERAGELTNLLEAHSFRLVRECYWDGLIMQTAFADELNNGLIVDLYYFHRGLFEGAYLNVNDASVRCKPEQFVIDRRRTFWPGTDIVVYVPHPVESYLEWRFGPEWKIPKSNSQLGPIDNACLRPVPTATALTYGTFDLLHHGHVSLLQRAKALGDQLVVGIVADEICRIKGKTPWENEAVRASAVSALDCVDAVFIQRRLDQKEFDIDRFGSSYLVVGDDWRDHPRFEAVRGYHGVEIVYLPRTPGVSSTSIKQSILSGEA